MKKSVVNFLLLLLCAAGPASRAGVVVTQNISPGATSWPGSPIVSTMANPAGSATVGENFAGGGGNTNISQTFTITTTNYLLQTIDLYVGGGSGTASGTNLVLNLYDLGPQTGPNPNPYTGVVNLFGNGAGLSISYANQANAILKLDFTGSDQVFLQNGHMYAFELSGNFNTQPAFWERAGSDTYSGGAAYRNQTWLNGANNRDFALAVYGSTNSSSSISGQCLTDWNDVHQHIDGFGASSAWLSTWTTAQADMFFSTNSGTGLSKNGTNFSFTGVGLSLLRNRIAPGGSTVETSIMQMAQARGARVWSTPWSPTNTFKSNNNVNGGSFVGTPANYQAYAAQQAGYVATMKQVYGVNIYAISVQNEPDAQVTTYDSCNWTAQQIHDFVPYLSAALIASNAASTKIMLPESQNWQDYSNLAVTAMTDPVTSNLVSIVADHNYDGSYGPVSQAKNTYGKALWETEVSLLSGDDSSIANGVYYAGRIHQFLTAAQVNAWHYWWLMPGNSTSNQGLADTNNVPAKRMYALGQFSRFIRPDFYRIGVNAGNGGGAYISAYKDSASSGFAIVAVNGGNVPIIESFTLTNAGPVGQVTPWITSSNLSLAQQTAVTVAGQSFTYSLPAMSIVTFVGAVSNTSPVFHAIAPQVVNPGIVFIVTNTAIDTDAPPQTLTYTLAAAPANATVNSQSGVFTWRPSVIQTNSTNTISVRVTDNGTPPLSATNIFKVTVNPLSSNPTLGTAALTGGQFKLSVNGPFGPDYTLLVSSNLNSWQTLLTSNSPVLPFIFTDPTTPLYHNHFYRVQIGP
jgi:glucuronoarabinoxylan endo-1,4-beta-xylanase